MSVDPGTRLGPYAIVSPLGAGGMGEVYRARDERLRRDVAIKVLPASVAEDTERLRRFEQEALATAALNHPNILVVFDIGTEANTTFVVEELLEGRTLREVIDAGALPLRKVIDYAAQIAQGLAAAHSKGVVHRDLKPENLFVTDDDRVKILDFGLAKVVETQASSGATSTVLAGTEPGMVLGTIGYMAPEQVRGVAVDHRADIFSFGAVLYELLTGRRAFQGETTADTMTAILKEPPPEIGTDSRPVPGPLARVVERCLEKQPTARFQSASDLAFALQALGSDVRSGSGSTPALADSPRDSRATGWMPIAVAVAAGAIVASGLWVTLAPAPAPPSMVTLDVAAPAGQVFGREAALSPDGSRLAFVLQDREGRNHLWIRELNSGAVTIVAGTENAGSPFWSPDGSEIGFFSDLRLRAAELDSGRVRVICDAPGIRTFGTWNQHGRIVFSMESILQQVAADGRSAPEPIADARGHRPQFLPDGRHVVLGFASAQGRSLDAVDIESGEVVRLRDGGSAPQYAAGRLVFELNGELVVQPFDAGALRLSGEPHTVAQLNREGGVEGPGFTVSDRVLALVAGAPPTERVLAWYTRDGSRVPVQTSGGFMNPALSPDGDMLIGTRGSDLGATPGDLYLYEFRRGTDRLLASGTNNRIFTAGWMDDGVVWFKRLGGSGSVVRKVVSSGEEQTSDSVAGMFMTGLTPAGLSLGFQIRQGNRDVLFMRPGDTEPTAFASTPINETQPALSPDEQWLAYVSSGLGGRGGGSSFARSLSDVYIQRFPAGGDRQLVSGGAPGIQPRWRADGRELYYVGDDGRMMAVPITPSAGGLSIGQPVALFQTSIVPQPGIGTRASYDVTRDGRRFIVSEEPEGNDDARGPTSITVRIDWSSAVR